jgi:hypothetical protein
MERVIEKRGWTAALVVAVSVWVGLDIGVSFIATSTKFLAPSLTLPVALDVGRYTFGVFNKIELGWGVLTLILLALGARRGWNMFGVAVAFVMVLIEMLWLLPALDARVDMIIAGQTPPPSSLHSLYVVVELLKLVALLAVAWRAARSLAAPRPVATNPAARAAQSHSV